MLDYSKLLTLLAIPICSVTRHRAYNRVPSPTRRHHPKPYPRGNPQISQSDLGPSLTNVQCGHTLSPLGCADVGTGAPNIGVGVDDAAD